MKHDVPEQLPLRQAVVKCGIPLTSLTDVRPTAIRFTHEELKPTELFSTLAALTPFSNHNQSPRNMPLGVVVAQNKTLSGACRCAMQVPVPNAQADNGNSVP